MVHTLALDPFLDTVLTAGQGVGCLDPSCVLQTPKTQGETNRELSEPGLLFRTRFLRERLGFPTWAKLLGAQPGLPSSDRAALYLLSARGLLRTWPHICPQNWVHRGTTRLQTA